MSFMNWIETIKSFAYNYEELWHYYIDKLKEFEDVNRLDELIKTISSLKNNEIFHRYATWDKICEKNKEFRFNTEKVYFAKFAKKNLGYQHLIPLFIFPTSLILAITLNGKRIKQLNFLILEPISLSLLKILIIQRIPYRIMMKDFLKNFIGHIGKIKRQKN